MKIKFAISFIFGLPKVFCIVGYETISGECNQFLDPDPYRGVPVASVEICLNLIPGTSAA
jgi:hypothetical protein